MTRGKGRLLKLYYNVHFEGYTKAEGSFIMRLTEQQYAPCCKIVLCGSNAVADINHQHYDTSTANTKAHL
jgi:hypothetical protein